MEPARHTARTLATKRLILRQATIDDQPEFHAFIRSPRFQYIRQDHEPTTPAQFFNNVMAHWQRHGFGHFIMMNKATNTSVGYVAAIDIPTFPEREIGYAVWDGQEGNGYATEGADAVLAFVFATLGWDTAVSYIHPDNHGSIRVAERLGARLDPNADAPPACALVYRHPYRTGS